MLFFSRGFLPDASIDEHQMLFFLTRRRGGPQSRREQRKLLHALKLDLADHIVDEAGRLPADAWSLFQVVLYERAIDVMAKGIGDAETA